MEMNEYQKLAARTAVYPKEQAFQYLGLGLAGEAGEVANKIKKMLRDDGGLMTPERAGAILDELGDVLWYVARLATELGGSLEDVAQMNVAKLARRYAKGGWHE